MLDWIMLWMGLRAVDLTVRAQAIAANNPDSLVWPAYYRRTPATSMKLSELTTVDYRFIADRRPWDADGRKLEEKVGPLREAEFVPIGDYFTLGEKEITTLVNQFAGNREVFAENLKVRVPDKVQKLVMGALRRLQLDGDMAWAKGQINIRNPETGQTVTVSLGFDAGRYQTAGTAWSDPGVNALSETVDFLLDAQETMGPLGGIRVSTKFLRQLIADGGDVIYAALAAGNRPRVGATDISEFLSDQTGNRIRLITDDSTYNPDLASAKTRYWPVGHMAAIPATQYIGEMRFAPVARAAMLASEVPDAKVDIRDVTIFYESVNSGKGLKVEGQLNAFPWPDEQAMFVIDTGIT